MPAPDRSIRVLPVPLDLAWKDPATNLDRIAAVLRGVPASASAEERARTLLVFPELTLTGFVTADPASVALAPDAPAIVRLCTLAAEAGVALVAGWPERTAPGDGGVVNVAGFIDAAGRILGRYRKMHLFPVGSPSESATYTRGTEALVVRWQGWRVGFATCFDLRFPALFGAYAQAGVDLLVTPACWVGGPWKSAQFRTLATAHAITTQAYVAAVNRAGTDPSFFYAGDALVAAPTGQVLEGGTPLELSASALAEVRRMPLRAADHASYTTREGVPEE